MKKIIRKYPNNVRNFYEVAFEKGESIFITDAERDEVEYKVISLSGIYGASNFEVELEEVE